jgi:hypothetical protein
MAHGSCSSLLSMTTRRTCIPNHESGCSVVHGTFFRILISIGSLEVVLHGGHGRSATCHAVFTVSSCGNLTINESHLPKRQRILAFKSNIASAATKYPQTAIWSAIIDFESFEK